MSYVTTSFKNPLMAPVDAWKSARDTLDKLDDLVTKIGYWLNPRNWFIEANLALQDLIQSPHTGIAVIVATIIGIWLIMLGANWPKKWLFWGWITYWVLRGFVYNF